MDIKKRFIAGAICPNCEQIDKLVVFTIANKHFSECVSCGFKQEAVNQREKPKKESNAVKKIIWLKKAHNE